MIRLNSPHAFGVYKTIIELERPDFTVGKLYLLLPLSFVDWYRVNDLVELLDQMVSEGILENGGTPNIYRRL